MEAPANSPQAALEHMIERLHGGGRLRVWSLVVTLLGDAVASRGGTVALSALGEVMDRLRIEPGALRTAMSRLAADGWVEREKQGRNAYYRLAAGGRQAFDLATRRIYAKAAPPWNGRWTVVIAPDERAFSGGAPAETLGFVRAGSRVLLRPDIEGAPAMGSAFADALVIHGHSAEHPETLLALWPAGEFSEAYSSFMDRWAALAAGAAQTLTGMDAVAARGLLIHDWRRIVLRDPGLPSELLPADWPGTSARERMHAIYAALLPESDAWWDARLAAGAPSGA